MSPADLRPSWADTWLGVAAVLAHRSTCLKRHVGAVLVSPENVILSTGYNGSPAGTPHCTEVGCLILPSGKCGRCIHAEVNALVRARVIPQGSTLYVTIRPCFSCAALAVNLGIGRVVYRAEHQGRDDGTPNSVQFLQECGVEVVHYPILQGDFNGSLK